MIVTNPRGSRHALALMSVQHQDQLRRSILAGAVSCILLFYGVVAPLASGLLLQV
jgi:hypothetical protein